MNISSLCPTRFQCELLWTIWNYEINSNQGEEFNEKSPFFSDPRGPIKWYLNLCTEDHQLVIFELFTDDKLLVKHGPLIVQFEYAFINAEGKMVNKNLERFRLNSSDRFFYIRSFPPDVPSLLNTSCIHDNQLQIYCRLSYVREAEVNSYLFDRAGLTEENFEMFVDNNEFSDVIVYVGDRKFHCHKVILAAKSSVFRAMLTHDMKEKASNRIDVKDIDGNIFQQVLRFIYTGKVEISEATVFQLLPVADIYDLANLKALCEMKLSAMLAVTNAVKIFSISNTYNLENVKAQAIEFIQKNLNEIANSNTWNDLASQPNLMEILLKKFAK